MRVRPYDLALVAALSLAGCAGDSSGAQSGPEQPEEAGPATEASLPPLRPETASIQTTLVNQRCLPCHATAKKSNRYVNLTDLHAVIGPRDDGVRVLIVPGCPEKSLFHGMMNEARMPPEPALPVATSDLAIVAEWITKMVPDAERDCSDADEPGTDPNPVPDPDEPPDEEPPDDGEPGD